MTPTRTNHGPLLLRGCSICGKSIRWNARCAGTSIGNLQSTTQFSISLKPLYAQTSLLTAIHTPIIPIPWYPKEPRGLPPRHRIPPCQSHHHPLRLYPGLHSNAMQHRPKHRNRNRNRNPNRNHNPPRILLPRRHRHHLSRHGERPKCIHQVIRTPHHLLHLLHHIHPATKLPKSPILKSRIRTCLQNFNSHRYLWFILSKAKCLHLPFQLTGDPKLLALDIGLHTLALDRMIPACHIHTSLLFFFSLSCNKKVACSRVTKASHDVPIRP